MNSSSSRSVRHSFHGTLWVMISDVLVLSFGFGIFIFLGRKLGPGGYGLYSLAAVLILWIEWSISSIFDKATVKLISETEDWQSIATATVRLQLAVSIIITIIVILFADALAALFQEPALAGYIRLFAIDIPIFCLAQSHKNILDGTFSFRKRALTTLGRWFAKFVLIFLLIKLGFSINGAIIANILASVVELGLSRFWIRPIFLRSSEYPVRKLLLSYGMPLFVQSLCFRLFGRMDLFVLKALGGTAVQAGIYSAAQNLSIPAGMIGISFSVIMLSTLSKALSKGDIDLAKKLMGNAMRVVFWIMPFVALLPWFASDLIMLILGEKYIQAGPLLSVMVFGALSSTMFLINIAALIASGKTYLTVVLSFSMLIIAFAGHLVVIPRMGSLGAAYVTTVVSVAGALCSIIFVCRPWNILPPYKTIIRSAGIALFACMAAVWWPLAATLPAIKFLVISAVCSGLFFISGEFTTKELLLFRAMLSMRERPENES